MVHLPEHCLFCGRELNPFELAVVLDSGEEKHAGRVTFGESAEGVRCRDCAPQGVGQDPERN